MPYPQRVRCSPLGREERILEVVDVELRNPDDAVSLLTEEARGF